MTLLTLTRTIEQANDRASVRTVTVAQGQELVANWTYVAAWLRRRPATRGLVAHLRAELHGGAVANSYGYRAEATWVSVSPDARGRPVVSASRTWALARPYGRVSCFWRVNLLGLRRGTGGPEAASLEALDAVLGHPVRLDGWEHDLCAAIIEYEHSKLLRRRVAAAMRAAPAARSACDVRGAAARLSVLRGAEMLARSPASLGWEVRLDATTSAHPARGEINTGYATEEECARAARAIEI